MTSYLKVFWFMLLNFHHILQHLTEVSGEVLLTQVLHAHGRACSFAYNTSWLVTL